MTKPNVFDIDAATMDRKVIDFDQGWAYMENGIKKLKRILEGLPETQFTSEEYMMLYTYPFIIGFQSLFLLSCIND